MNKTTSNKTRAGRWGTHRKTGASCLLFTLTEQPDSILDTFHIMTDADVIKGLCGTMADVDGVPYV